MSGYTGMGSVYGGEYKDAKRSDAVTFLQKPFLLDVFLQKVRELLDDAKGREARSGSPAE